MSGQVPSEGVFVHARARNSAAGCIPQGTACSADMNLRGFDDTAFARTNP